MRLGPPWLLGPVGSEFLGSMTVLWKSRRFTRGSQVDVFFANPHLIQLFPQFLLIPGTPRDPRRTNSKQLGLPVGHSKQSSGLCVPSWLLHLPDPLKIRWDEGIYNGEDLNHVNDPIFKTHLKLNVKFNGEDHRQPTWGFEHWKEMIHRRFSIVIKTGEFYWTFCCLGNGRKMFSQSMLWAIAWKDYSRIARVNQMEFSHSRTPEKKIAWHKPKNSAFQNSSATVNFNRLIYCWGKSCRCVNGAHLPAGQAWQFTASEFCEKSANWWSNWWFPMEIATPKPWFFLWSWPILDQRSCQENHQRIRGCAMVAVATPCTPLVLLLKHLRVWDFIH